MWTKYKHRGKGCKVEGVKQPITCRQGYLCTCFLQSSRIGQKGSHPVIELKKAHIRGLNFFGLNLSVYIRKIEIYLMVFLFLLGMFLFLLSQKKPKKSKIHYCTHYFVSRPIQLVRARYSSERSKLHNNNNNWNINWELIYCGDIQLPVKRKFGCKGQERRRD